MQRTKQAATIGRVLLAFSAAWSGPRSATVVGEGTGTANVNIAFDGVNDRPMLDKMRGSPQGNTFLSLPVYDPLSPEERAVALKAASPSSHDVAVILEWPAVPAAAGGGRGLSAKEREDLRSEIVAELTPGLLAKVRDEVSRLLEPAPAANAPREVPADPKAESDGKPPPKSK